MSVYGLGFSGVNWAKDFDANNAKVNRWYYTNKNVPLNNSGVLSNIIIRVDGVGDSYFCQTAYGLKETGYNQTIWVRWYESHSGWTEWVKIFDMGSPPLKLESGTYIGTGTYGSSNPNTITFSF